MQTHMRYMRVIYLVGYSISLIALTVAVIIMLYIKSVQHSSLFTYRQIESLFFFTKQHDSIHEMIKQ